MGIVLDLQHLCSYGLSHCAAHVPLAAAELVTGEISTLCVESKNARSSLSDPGSARGQSFSLSFELANAINA